MKWISFIQAKVEQELYKQLEDRWWIRTFRGKIFTDEEWEQYLKDKNKEMKPKEIKNDSSLEGIDEVS